MSDSKPCPALEWIDSDRIHGLHEACATCPNRKPVSLEGLVKSLEARILGSTINGFQRGQNTAYRDAVALVRLYQKELNNG
jgi:hypothetical protein